MGKLEHNTTDELQLKLSSCPTPHDDEDEDDGPSTFTTFELRLFPSSYYSLVLTTDNENLATLQENQAQVKAGRFDQSKVIGDYALNETLVVIEDQSDMTMDLPQGTMDSEDLPTPSSMQNSAENAGQPHVAVSPLHEVVVLTDPEVDLGAEVVCGEQPTDGVEPEWSGLTDRVSYEEIIHSELEDSPSILVDDSLESCLSLLTQWALSLHDILDERLESNLRPESTNCVCPKAKALIADLRALEEHFLDTLSLHDRISDVHYHLVKARITELKQLLMRMHESLRVHISIQISIPKRDFVDRANFLVQSVSDSRRYLNDAFESIIDLIKRLLLVDSCLQVNGTCLERQSIKDDNMDEDDSPLQDRVENFLNDGRLSLEFLEDEIPSNSDSIDCAHMECDDTEEEEGDEEEEEEEDKENQPSRKRKTEKGPTKEPQISPTSSPRKKPRGAKLFMSLPVSPTEDSTKNANLAGIVLLEKSRKGPRKDGLYQFVLWREALKAAKRSLTRSCATPSIRPCLSPPQSPPPSARRRILG
ncbi:uncharacterized protein LOC131885716 isoform X2 [Tigriopus californicus]|uniref:uncharacterized protein LOC131885716 isoform X2 n=1 Tax=Tigriopus californicus TaxID=6832 RepID=UPI0027DA3CF9|nr:uncharacterized protein LOC131885716 isoform X2 [Tigriopus californicus]XP_059089834.1 uncharacterized protein LOC131885716 isoform X2 [Tigriopus californicus]